MRAYAPRLIETQGSGRVLPSIVLHPDAVPCTARDPVGGHRAVVMTSHGIIYADKDTPEHFGLVMGVTCGAIGCNDRGYVQTKGTLTEGSWNWTPTLPIFLGNNGMLTQDVPNSGFLLPLGTAVDQTTMYVKIGQGVEI